MRLTVKHILLTCSLLASLALPAEVYYVTPEGNPFGAAWTHTVTLEEALSKAVAGDQIWVQGFSRIAEERQVYRCPAEGFTLPAGVRLYGGFKGDEDNPNARPTGHRAFEFTYRTVLSADIQGNDSITAT